MSRSATTMVLVTNGGQAVIPPDSVDPIELARQLHDATGETWFVAPVRPCKFPAMAEYQQRRREEIRLRAAVVALQALGATA